MPEQNKPEIITLQVKRDEFLFLGKEYSLQKPDFKEIWDDFDHIGGWDMASKYHVKPYGGMMTVWYKKNSDCETYFVGTMTENADGTPEGYTLVKFPACEFLVITTEWQPEHDELYSEYGGHKLCIAYMNNVQMPAGYMRYSGPESKINFVEAENCDDENGFRYEIWIPIKKF